MPCSLQNATTSRCCQVGCSSIWLTAGHSPVSSYRRVRCSGRKLHTPSVFTAFVAQLGERLPGRSGTPIERSRPMNHVHVDVFQLQQSQLSVEGCKCHVVPLLGVAQLGRDPQMTALAPLVEAGFGEGAADAALVVVARGSVDMPVPRRQRRFDHGSDIIVLDSQQPQPDLRNHVAVIEFDSRHARSSRRNGEIAGSQHGRLLVFTLHPVRSICHGDMPSLPTPVCHHIG